MGRREEGRREEAGARADGPPMKFVRLWGEDWGEGSGESAMREVGSVKDKRERSMEGEKEKEGGDDEDNKQGEGTKQAAACITLE